MGFKLLLTVGDVDEPWLRGDKFFAVRSRWMTTFETVEYVKVHGLFAKVFNLDFDGSSHSFNIASKDLIYCRDHLELGRVPQIHNWSLVILRCHQFFCNLVNCQHFLLKVFAIERGAGVRGMGLRTFYN